ncbi:hypothetical protein RSOL_191410 [Rhizoctonia solani AG-3 Rhs1AP]|uniref:Uncharacterized protein n=2 Tax=Rhizoctonia solani AG-3 TaxID=1086053 RepID=A0A074S6T3_9AGAM|nr:hypothetical protein RSOL_191410 [Rhizoctonia solani AG-3 Rhs1AP]KEP52583.1 hypothetical protein V565_043000 [Rhizoctonia solani 123E]
MRICMTAAVALFDESGGCARGAEYITSSASKPASRARLHGRVGARADGRAALGRCGYAKTKGGSTTWRRMVEAHAANELGIRLVKEAGWRARRILFIDSVLDGLFSLTVIDLGARRARNEQRVRGR